VLSSSNRELQLDNSLEDSRKFRGITGLKGLRSGKKEGPLGRGTTPKEETGTLNLRGKMCRLLGCGFLSRDDEMQRGYLPLWVLVLFLLTFCLIFPSAGGDCRLRFLFFCSGADVSLISKIE